MAGLEALMHAQEHFCQHFKLLTGHCPFPWQRKLCFEMLEGKWRRSFPVPTGLGKTSTITVWLLSLAYLALNGKVGNFPRRLVYVVNRRTVVDQATREAEAIRGALQNDRELHHISQALQSLQTREAVVPLAISSLRGQFADNAEWRGDPTRPAVIVGTVDMIGSRLLFSGYGCGFKSRPLHAGFLGQDTLLVHDEAHLEPAFQELILAIEAEQDRCKEFGRFRVMELTATSRSAVDSDTPLFTDADRTHVEVRKRIEAKKGIVCHPVDDEKDIADKVIVLAREHKDSGQAILVFLRKLEDVERMVGALRKEKLQVETLTGTLRGYERDDLARTNRIFARFMPNPETVPQEGTVYLVCTSAGEVGVNISADHLVCDLTPLESMTQRFGRVNRFGKGDAQIDIVHHKFDDTHEIGPATAELAMTTNSQDDMTEDPQSKKKKDKQLPYDRACELTLTLLQRLPMHEDGRYDASPAALSDLPLSERQAAFTPTPIILPASDILFDAWAMTSIREKLPGRPPVVDWLHGIADWEPADTHVAWREEVGLVTQDLMLSCTPEDLLEDYPLKPHELLRDRTTRVFSHLQKIATRCPDLSAWVIDPEGQVNIVPFGKLVEKNKQNKSVVNLEDRTVLLPPVAGGLYNGLLDGEAVFEETGGTRYDVADLWLDTNSELRRCRLWDEQPFPEGMRLIRTIDTWTNVDHEDEEGETPQRRYWHWLVRPRAADDDGSRTARTKQELLPHLQTAESFAKRLVTKLRLKELEAKAVILAARYHDLGKDRLIWQRSIGNHEYPSLTLAKSGPDMRPIEITRYRHEFGSLSDAAILPEFRELPQDEQDLVLHLIAAHHGRARPHFPPGEVFDPNRPEDMCEEIADEIPRRFARLQREYGRWGLAYLESLVRAADALASQAGTDADPVVGSSASFDGGES